MRGKRAKQYRKLMRQYALTFNFREPYQVLVDAQIIQDADKFTMDLIGGLERTLQGKIKPMITQCSIRHLYALPTSDLPSSRKEALISQAKNMERRRCNHHTLEEPMSSLNCFKEVIDPKGSLTNKNRYIVASQDEEVRRYCRAVKGVPLVYVKRSVMVMEPMAESSLGVQASLENEKMRTGIRKFKADVHNTKRKRDDDAGESSNMEMGLAEKAGDASVAKKRKVRGPKGPNPLSVKKSKIGQSRNIEDRSGAGPENEGLVLKPVSSSNKHAKGNLVASGRQKEPLEVASRRKRRRKHKPGGWGGSEIDGEPTESRL